MLALLAGYAATASVPAAAQGIVVNGVSCPTASIRFSLAGMLATLPETCSGNGNPCDSALVTYTSTGIVVSAPVACLTASPIATPISLQSTTVNGASCNGATVTFSAGAVAIDAPLACLAVVPPAPAISGVSPTSAYAGQSVTITGSNFAADATVSVGGVAAVVLATTSMSLSIGIPIVQTGMQPVVVSVNGQVSAAFPMNIVAVPAQLVLRAVQSRKVHGSAGTFDLPIDTTQAIGGSVTVEPRNPGAGHTIVFQFDSPITSAGVVSAVDVSGALMAAITVAASGNSVVVTMPSVPDASRATVTLTGLNGGASSASASMGFLAGDVNNSRSVNSSDISAIKSRSGQVIDQTNYMFDVDASGVINSSDISAAKARSGRTLP